MFGMLSYKKQKWILLASFLFIPLALLCAFSLYPALDLLYLSFTSWDGYSPEKLWVGFANYKQVFSDPAIFGVFSHNLAYFLVGVVQNVVAVYFAVVLNSKLRGRNLFRLLLFVPYIMNGVAVMFMFGYVYDTTLGSLNLLLHALGLDALQQSWLGNRSLVNFSLAFIGFWKYTGFNMVVYLGALQSLPADMYEAARIDGAGAWQTFRFITLPNLLKIVELNLFLTVTGALEVFDTPFVLTHGGPAGASTTFVYQVVQTAFQFAHYGLASAMSVVLLAIVILVLGLQRALLNRRGD